MDESKGFVFNENLMKYISDRINYSLDYRLIENNKMPLSTQNRLNPAFWDILNGEIIKYSANDISIYVFISKRRNWEFILILDNNTEILYSLMKENNFKQLQRKVSQRGIPHYCDLLARVFNKELNDLEQMKMDDYIQSEPPSFSDESKINIAIDNILINLARPKTIIKNHALILFDTNKSEIKSMKIVMINSNFDICLQENLNKYIMVNYTIIPEVIDPSNIAVNDMMRGLTFTQKAKDKIDQKNNIGFKDVQREKEDNI